MSYSNKDITNHLKELAKYAMLDGVNPYKIRAYQEAARVIETYPKSIEDMVKNREDLKKYLTLAKK